MRHLGKRTPMLLLALIAGLGLWSSVMISPAPGLAAFTIPPLVVPGATLNPLCIMVAPPLGGAPVCYAVPTPTASDNGCGKGHDVPCCPDGTNPKDNGGVCANPSPSTDPKSTAGNDQSADGGAFKGAGFLFPGLGFFQNLGTQFAQKARDAALRLYFVLFSIELAMFGIQFLLFKGENMGEFFASLTFKIFVAGFFIWLISNAATIFPTIVASFSQAGQDISGANMDMLGSLAGKAMALGVAFIAAASIAQGVDQLMGGLEGIEILGNGDPGVAFGGEIGHLYFIQACVSLAFLVIGSLLVIVMTLVIITVESYIVMTAGIFFLGFAGTRFTMPYAQGYMSYAINVGAKMFTFWMVIRVENEMLSANAAANALSIVPIFAAAAIPNGIAALLALPFGIFLAFEFMILSAIAYAIPSLAGSFLSGASSMSATTAMGNAMNTMNAAGKMSSGLRSAVGAGMSRLGITSGSSEGAMARLQQRESSGGGAGSSAPSLSAGGGSGAGGDSSTGAATPRGSAAAGLSLVPPSKSKGRGGSDGPIDPENPAFHTPSRQTTQYQTVAAETGAGAADSGDGGSSSGGGGGGGSKAESLASASPSEISSMSPIACAERYAATRSGALSTPQRAALREKMNSDPDFGKAVKAISRDKLSARREKQQDRMNAFGNAMQTALVPTEDDAAKFGGMAPKFGSWKE